MSVKEMRERHYKFIVTHRMSHGEVEAHEDRGELLDALREINILIPEWDEYADCDTSSTARDIISQLKAILDKL